VWRVEAGGQHVDVAEVVQFAAPKPAQNRVALRSWHFASDEPALQAVLVAQHANDVLAMLDAAGEDQDGAALGGVGDGFAAGSLDEPIVVHQVLDLVGHELAGPHVQPAEVGLVDPRLGDERVQVALDNQLANADLVANMVEEAVRRADRSGPHAEGRGREADDPHVGVDRAGVGQELPIHAVAVRRDHVHLIDHHQVERVELTGPLVHRLDARHDHRAVRVPPLQARRVDAERYLRADGPQLVDGLLEQLLDVRQDQDAAAPARHCILADGRHDRRLAACGRDHDAWIVVPHAQVRVDGSLGLLLVRS
jgi:hypothetical protein